MVFSRLGPGLVHEFILKYQLLMCMKDVVLLRISLFFLFVNVLTRQHKYEIVCITNELVGRI